MLGELLEGVLRDVRRGRRRDLLLLRAQALIGMKGTTMNKSNIIRTGLLFTSALFLVVGCTAPAASEDEPAASQSEALYWGDESVVAFAESAEDGDGDKSKCSVKCTYGSCSIVSPFKDRPADCQCFNGVPQCTY
jgi:hypothetical protein